MLPLKVQKNAYFYVLNTFPNNKDDIPNHKSNRSIDKLEEQVRQLVTEARRHLPGSAKRQKILTTIVRLISNKLWKKTPYYQDALQQTWVYFCQNLCEINTCEVYEPMHGSVITWLNTYLKWRLQDLYIEAQKQQARTASVQIQMSESGEANETLNLVDYLEDVMTWVETDPKGEFHRTYIEGHPEVTC
jgi:hypothetical protein